ncbi:Diacylglycerol lipase-alpha [Halotydeus destructor]|nr:Diacylglycerol lipase-alpha [Halotydeus destructor]
MPGLIVFKRRWAVGSDDLIVPGIFLLVVHSCWLLVLLIVLGMVEERDWLPPCMTDLYEHTVGYIIILGGCIAVEYFIAAVSLRGTILDDRPREPMQYLLYVRLGLFLVEMVWLFIGVLWIRSHYDLCPGNFAKEAIMGITITNWSLLGRHAKI